MVASGYLFLVWNHIRRPDPGQTSKHTAYMNELVQNEHEHPLLEHDLIETVEHLVMEEKSI